MVDVTENQTKPRHYVCCWSSIRAPISLVVIGVAWLCNYIDNKNERNNPLYYNYSIFCPNKTKMATGNEIFIVEWRSFLIEYISCPICNLSDESDLYKFSGEVFIKC